MTSPVNVESLSRDFLHVAEEAAIEAARTMGKGQRRHSDHVAVDAMRRAMDNLPMRGTVAIGEGERDEAPMLYIGEKVGRGQPGDVEVDIAVDPLEGTNLCATGSPGAIAVLAAANRGGLLHAPDCYMDKIVVGPAARNAIDLDAPAEDNLKAIARCLNRAVTDLVVIVGYSTCSVEVLKGPAIWTARVADDKVIQWRVFDDTPEVRQLLGLRDTPR